MTGGNPMDFETLHEYLDDQLDAAARAEVERYLAAHPEEYERVEEYRAHNETIRRLYDNVLAEPVPACLSGVLQPRAIEPDAAADNSIDLESRTAG